MMLSELIEQNNKQQKDVAAIKSSLEFFSGKMTELRIREAYMLA